MSKIVVPVDFSPTSAMALEYASWLSVMMGYSLVAVYARDGYGAEDPLFEVPGDVPAQLKAQREVAGFVRQHAFAVSMTEGEEEKQTPLSESHAIIGKPAAVIISMSMEEDVALIVMGGVGAGANSADRVFDFGSVARAVALKSGVPVLMIPKGFGTPSVMRISYAFDEVTPLRMIMEATEFMREALDAQVRLVHQMDPSDRQERHKQADLLDEIITSDFPGFPVEIDMLDPADLSDSLADYVMEYDIDLLVMGRRRRSFFGRLFIPSEVKPLLSSCPVPLLVVPIDNFEKN